MSAMFKQIDDICKSNVMNNDNRRNYLRFLKFFFLNRYFNRG